MKLRGTAFRMSRKISVRRAHLALEQLEDRSLLDASAMSPTRLLIGVAGPDGPVVQLVELPAGADLSQAIAAYSSQPGVLYAEPDYQVNVSGIPNDPSFGQLYGLNNTGQGGGTQDADIDAPEAWDITTGSRTMVVAEIDTGIDYTHIDLYRNIWINQGEIPSAIRSVLIDTDSDGIITFWDLNDSQNQGAGKITDLNGNGRIDGDDLLYTSAQGGWANGVSDDGDSFVDDIIGWNFVSNTNRPYDDNGHGTHVAGTMGATGNDGIGVVGVNWSVEIAPLKFLNSSGSGSTSAAVAALNYAVAHGIKISNNSWGGGGYSTTLFNAINNARTQGHIFVAAAGNNGSNNDTLPSYPASYNLDNIISVAATDRNDVLATFSNYGATSVDIAAPGVGILSTTPHTTSSPNGTYSTFSGTSMATPHVSGVVALVRSLHPTWTYSEIIANVLNSADTIAGLSGRVAGARRLNAFGAVSAGASDTAGPRVTAAAPNNSGPGSFSSVRLTFSEAIDRITFTVDDITNFTGPNGAIQATGVNPVSGSANTQFDVTFASQTTAGTYRFVVGPSITDTAGNLMDQDRDGNLGEATDDQYNFSFTKAGSYTFSSTGPVAIRDLAVNSSTITINQDITISDLNVTLNITHTYDSDLYIHLRSPGGVDVLLVNRRGGSGDNFSNTRLDDEATFSIAAGAAPFAGAYRPEGSLSAYDTRNAHGVWTLYVEDRAFFDVGTINSWSLVITGSTSGSASSLGFVDEPLEVVAAATVVSSVVEVGAASALASTAAIDASLDPALGLVSTADVHPIADSSVPVRSATISATFDDARPTTGHSAVTSALNLFFASRGRRFAGSTLGPLVGLAPDEVTAFFSQP